MTELLIEHGIGEVAALSWREGQAGEGGDAVIALLAGHGDMGETERAKLKLRKLAFDAFDLLQTEHVRLVGFDQAAHEIEPEPDRIDVPGGEAKAHRRAKIGVSDGESKPWP